LPVDGELDTDARGQLLQIFAATTELAMMRDEATALCVGLADLDLPALVQVEILDAAFANAIPMHRKWDLVVAIKHWHQRRGNHG